MKLQNEEILLAARRFVRQALEHEASGHDWQHIVRVSRTAQTLASLEAADAFICELAALLHDIADEKLNPSKEAGLRKVQDWLDEAGVEATDRLHVMDIIATMSFGGGHGQPMSTLEGRIVQDADRLDALGAIGIARTFAYAGAKGGPLHTPGEFPRDAMSREEYRSGRSSAVNHFYEKLLKLTALMNTSAARALAEERHQFLLLYLRQLDAELRLGNADYLDESLVPWPRAEREAVHIAFGHSAAGSLRLALRGQLGSRIINLPDNLAVGPLSGDGCGVSAAERLAWLTRMEADASHLDGVLDWREWPQRLHGRSLIVWTGASAAEQLGLRRLAAELPETALSVITVSAQLPSPAGERARSVGECDPAQLTPLLGQAVPLSELQRSELASAWRRLVAEGGTLRLAGPGGVRTVPESHFDEAIVKAAQRLYAKTQTPVKSARVVGEVIGHAEQPIGDAFINYRLCELAAAGALQYEGKLGAMRDYSVFPPAVQV